MSPASITIFFDQECGLCRSLASFGQSLTVGDPRFNWSPSSNQSANQSELALEDQSQKPNFLLVEIVDADGQMTSLVEADAWSWLLSHLPALNRFQWMAAKLGLTDTALGQKAVALSYSVLKMIRRSCAKC
jgi:hypothetical protein